MSEFTIAIVGAGVIGASLGLALKRTENPPHILAHDKELSRAQAGVRLGAFDKAEWNLINACDRADLVVLAIPVDGIRPTLAALAPELKQGAIVSDTARSKAAVLAWAAELLPNHVHFVGGDPIVRAAGPGPSHASANLFQGRLYCLTPTPSAAEEAVQTMTALVSLLGAEPFFVDAGEHDGLVAAGEDLPVMASIALLATLAEPGAWREIRKLAGGLFEQVSGGAAGAPPGLAETLLSNRENDLRWLDSYITHLHHLRRLLETADREELTRLLERVVSERAGWLADYEQGAFTDPELISPRVESPGLWRRLMGMGR